VASLLAAPACSNEKGAAVELTERFELAEVWQERASIDIGTPEARRHLSYGWSHDERFEGHTFVWSIGWSSVIDFYLARPQTLTITLRGKPLAPLPQPQEVSVLANGAEVARIVLPPGLQERRVVVPAENLQAGINHLTLLYGQVHAPKDILEGNRDSRPLAVAWERLRFEELRDVPPPQRPTADHLLLPTGSKLEYLLPLAADSILQIGAVRAVEGFEGALQVRVEEPDGSWRTIAHLAAPTQGRRVALGLDSARIARLSLEATPGDAGPRKGALQIEEGRVGPVPGLADNGAPRPDLFVYLVDTLRADRLGGLGGSPSPTPEADAFAEESIRFLRAFAQSPWTRSSIASLFTGRTPAAHGVVEIEDALPSRWTTLAEALRAAGYRTVGFMTNRNSGAEFGFQQGFGEFVSLPSWQADAVNEQVFAWLDAQRGTDRPLFVYVHTIDPHSPYDPPEVFRRLYAPDVPEGPIASVEWFEKVHEGELRPSPTERGHLEALYNGDVAANDAAFGDFLSKLRSRELFEGSAVLFTSDHGEEFGEHGGYEHTHALYDESLRIPFLLKLPGAANRPGSRLSAIAQHVDVMPTLFAIAGLRLPVEVDGRSLLPAIREEEVSVAPVYAQTFRRPDGRQLVAGLHWPWKLIRERRAAEWTGHMELYGLEDDPEEREDLADELPQRRRFLASDLEEHVEANRGRVSPGRVEIEGDLQEQLKALGYAVE